MRFLVFPPALASPNAVRRAYFSGPDRFLWQCKTEATDEGLLVKREMTDSGYFSIPWNVRGRGERTLTTSWLMERDRPYMLQVELARGKLQEVRNQLIEWQSIGLSPPPELEQHVGRAVRQFLLAATSQHDPETAAQHAEQAIVMIVDAADMLGSCYCQQALAARTRQSSKLDTQLGVVLGDAPMSPEVAKQVRRCFNTVCAPINWREIEAHEGEFCWQSCDHQLAWGRENASHVVAGPLISFDEARMPDWLCLWEGDFDNLASCIAEFVSTTVKRNCGKFDLWHCAARVNTGDALSLTAEQRLKLAVLVVNLTQTHDPNTPAIISFDQPWAEYMNQQDVDPPLYVADTLIRAGLGISGVGLEINVGYDPGGSYPRDLLEFSQLIDRWSLLNVPLYLMLTCPSSDAEDPRALRKAQPQAILNENGCTLEGQQQWVERFLPLMLAKPYIRGVLWNQLSDAEPHGFAHGGVLDAGDQPKPALSVLASLRRKYLE